MHPHHSLGFIEFEPLAIGGIDLVAFVVALVGVIFLFAGWVVFWVLNEIFGGISVFGAHPFGFVAGLLQRAMKNLSTIMVGRLSAFGHFIWSITMTVWRFLWTMGDVLAVFAFRILDNFYTLVAQIVSLGFRVDHTQESNFDYLNGQIQTLENERSIDRQYFTGLINGDVAVLRQQEATDIAALKDQLAHVGGVDLSGVQAEINSLSNQLVAEETALGNQINNAVTNLTQQLTGVSTKLESEITNGVSTAEGFATSLVAGLGLGSITSTLTSLAGRLSKVETETADCLTPLCDTVTPQAKRLGNQARNWQNLEDLGIAALLIALAAECLSNPGAVVHDIETVTHDAGDAILTGFRDLIGA